MGAHEQGTPATFIVSFEQTGMTHHDIDIGLSGKYRSDLDQDAVRIEIVGVQEPDDLAAGLRNPLVERVVDAAIGLAMHHHVGKLREQRKRIVR